MRETGYNAKSFTDYTFGSRCVNLADRTQDFDFGFSLDGGFPQGNFKDNVESNGFGIEGIFAYSVPYSPDISLHRSAV